MLLRPSTLVKRLIGTHVESGTPPAQPALLWVQHECHDGRFTSLLSRFAAEQPEDLDVQDVVVEGIDSAGLICCRFYGTAVDHENRSPFTVQVEARLNPVLGSITRL